MSRPRFLADHDLNERIIIGVLRREPTVEFHRVRDFGLEEGPDGVVLAHAASEGFIVISHDVNTMISAARDRVAAGQPMAGLLMSQQTDPVGPIIESLILLWSATDAEEWRNLICFLPLK
jgi:hypothetical protein